MKKKKTLYINLIAGPGAGKTTLVYFLAYLMKKKGYNIEFEQEIAKKLVYKGDDRINHQEEISKKQFENLIDLDGYVDFIITDGSILHGLYFNRYNELNRSDVKKTETMIIKNHNQMNCVNIYLKRDKTKLWEQNGRKENREQSYKIDEILKEILDEKNIEYKEFPSDEIYAEKMIEYIESKI